MQQSEQLNELAKSLAKAQGNFPTIPREREVEVKTKAGGSYYFSYAEFSTIREHVQPVLTDNGLSFVQSTSVTSNGGTILVTLLMHESGQWISAEMPVKQSEEGAQAFGSALTYAKRYALTLMLGLATEDDDDGNGAEGNEVQSATGQAKRGTAPSAETSEFRTLVAQAHAMPSLKENERKFVNEQHDRIKQYGDRVRPPTERQLSWLKQIVGEKPVAKDIDYASETSAILDGPPLGHPAYVGY